MEKKMWKIEQKVTEISKRKRVAAYARVSVESERMQHSLSAQISYYSSLIQKNPANMRGYMLIMVLLEQRLLREKSFNVCLQMQKLEKLILFLRNPSSGLHVTRLTCLRRFGT